MWPMVAVLVGFVGMGSGHTADMRCTTANTYTDYVRKQADTRVLARFVDRVVVRREDRSDPRGMREDLGSLVRIEAGDGAAVDDIASPGSEVVVFVWSLGGDCRRFTPALAVAPDSLHHFTMRLRPDSAWVAGRPTFDVDIRGWGVFPSGSPAARPDLDPYMLSLTARPDLTVQEYAHMLSLIPDEGQWAADCRPGMNELLRWYDAHGQPFKSIVPGLLGLCETSVELKARTFVRGGPAHLPDELIRWATRHGCRIPMNNAVRGRFTSTSESEWAIMCETDAEWKLLIVEPGTPEPLAILAWMKGPATDRAMALVPPEYFNWAPFKPVPSNQQIRAPSYDAVLLDESVVFYFTGAAWTSERSYCCVVRR